MSIGGVPLSSDIYSDKQVKILNRAFLTNDSASGWKTGHFTIQNTSKVPVCYWAHNMKRDKATTKLSVVGPMHCDREFRSGVIAPRGYVTVQFSVPITSHRVGDEWDVIVDLDRAADINATSDEVKSAILNKIVKRMKLFRKVVRFHSPEESIVDMENCDFDS